MALTVTAKNVRPLLGCIVRPYTLVTAGAVGDAVYFDSNGLAGRAKTNAASTAWGKGIIVAGEGFMPGTTFAIGQEVGVAVFGPVAGFTDMDLTKGVFVSAATAGLVTQTAPSGASTWTDTIGYPIKTDVLFIAPQNTAPASNS